MSKGLDSIFLKARAAEKNGDPAAARSLYQSVLDQFPGNARARQAIEQLDAHLAAAPLRASPPQDAIDRLIADYGAGRHGQVIAQGKLLQSRYADSAMVARLIGAAHAGMEDFREAAAAFRRSVALEPGNAQDYLNLGVSLQEQGEIEGAVESYRNALAIQPRLTDACFNLGTALQSLGRSDDAVAAYRRTVELDPNRTLAWYNLGNALRELHRFAEAVESYDRALAIDPAHVAALNNRGVALQLDKRLDEAILSFQRAAAIDAGHADAHNNLGNAMREMGSLDAAIEAFGRALAARPDFAEAENNLGNAYRDKGDLDLAVSCYERALSIIPGWSTVLAQKLHQQAHMCDWAAWDQFAAVGGSLGIEGGAVPPFTLLSFEDEPERQLLRSKAWARTIKVPNRALPAPEPSPSGKIRVGYFSADFHDHATLILMAGLFRHHDRSRFEIYAYSYGAVTGGAMREALIDHVDGFFDVKGLSDSAIVAMARGQSLDIAIDLKGYTAHNRVALFARRPAPLQISFVGYPGSLGAYFMDYVIGDPVVIPEADRHHYSEKLIELPYSYQPNDDQRPIAPVETTRADHGLPDRGFVFCCFNNSYKIGPAEFEIWMRLLAKVEDSVLWLLRSNRFAEANLRRATATHGIDDSRIIFADRLPFAEHLARHHHADLVLDTFHYNAHTTASDALWAGVPVVTKAGRQFAARVAASLLTAAELSELITRTTEDYEALALTLASEPARLASIRSKLADRRLAVPLFASELFTRHIEAAYEAVHRRRLQDMDQDHIRITPSDG